MRLSVERAARMVPAARTEVVVTLASRYVLSELLLVYGEIGWSNGTVSL